MPPARVAGAQTPSSDFLPPCFSSVVFFPSLVYDGDSRLSAACVHCICSPAPPANTPASAPWPSHPNVPTLSSIYISAETSVAHSSRVRRRARKALNRLRCRLPSSGETLQHAGRDVSSQSSIAKKKQQHKNAGGRGGHNLPFFFFPLSYSFFSRSCNWRDAHRSNRGPGTEIKTRQITTTVSNEKSFTLPGSSNPTWLHFHSVLLLSSAPL